MAVSLLYIRNHKHVARCCSTVRAPLCTILLIPFGYTKRTSFGGSRAKLEAEALKEQAVIEKQRKQRFKHVLEEVCFLVVAVRWRLLTCTVLHRAKRQPGLLTSTRKSAVPNSCQWMRILSIRPFKAELMTRWISMCCPRKGHTID